MIGAPWWSGMTQMGGMDMGGAGMVDPNAVNPNLQQYRNGTGPGAQPNFMGQQQYLAYLQGLLPGGSAQVSMGGGAPGQQQMSPIMALLQNMGGMGGGGMGMRDPNAPNPGLPQYQNTWNQMPGGGFSAAGGYGAQPPGMLGSAGGFGGGISPQMMLMQRLIGGSR